MKETTTVLYLSIVIFSTITQDANTISPCDESSWVEIDCIRSLQETILQLQDLVTNQAVQINLQALQMNETRRNLIDLQNNSGDLQENMLQLQDQVTNQAVQINLQALQLNETRRNLIDLQNNSGDLQENMLQLQDQVTNQVVQINLQALQMNETRRNLIDLQNNSVPIGFVYVQLSAQSEPHHLWPDMTWSEISSQYAGLFFRVLGGGSASFNVTQYESSPRISQAESGVMTGLSYSVNIPSNGWSFALSTGKQPLPLINPWGIKLFQTADELRPRNRAVRIWQRIN